MNCSKKLMYANVYAWIMVRDQSFPTTQGMILKPLILD